MWERPRGFCLISDVMKTVSKGHHEEQTTVALKHTVQISPEMLVYFTLTEKLSGTVRFRISAEILSLRIQWRAQVTWSLRQVSPVGCAVCPAQGGTAGGKRAHYFLSVHTYWACQVCVTASGVSKPAGQPMTFRRLWANTVGLIAILSFGLCHWVDRASWAVVILWLVRAATGIRHCVSRTLTGKPPCYSRSCPTWPLNNCRPFSWSASLRTLHPLMCALGLLFHPISLL